METSQALRAEKVVRRPALAKRVIVARCGRYVVMRGLEGARHASRTTPNVELPTELRVERRREDIRRAWRPKTPT